MEKVMLNAGVDFDIIRGELNGTTKKSSTGGELLYGSNNGYKNSLDRNYIPAAVATGNLTIKTLHKADTVRQLPDGRYEVTVHKINEQGETEYIKNYTANIYL